ncbi:redoxin domain-containing protein [Pirellulaceae bacterium SH467]
MSLIRNAFVVIAPLILLIAGRVAHSDEPQPKPVIPQTLLKLIHAPEVQEELGLQPDSESLMTILREIDGPWWRSRNLPEEKQQEVVELLERKLLADLKTILKDDRLRRLREIEVQSQGTRSLIRPGIAKGVGLSISQTQEIQKMFLETDKIARKLVESPKDDSGLESKLQSAREAEQKRLNDLLTASQRTSLGKLIGKPFDTLSLKRIYPLAPELIDSGEWTGGEPTTLADLRGKVVLVHFYAFQCHNCVANFDHYNRWQKLLVSRGVRVVGIQTPETSAERNVSLVKAAAKEKGFQFPVLIDLQNKNWDAWSNTMWPTVYVIDKKGYIRSWWQGELNWQGATGDKSIETLVDQLLAE